MPGRLYQSHQNAPDVDNNVDDVHDVHPPPHAEIILLSMRLPHYTADPVPVWHVARFHIRSAKGRDSTDQRFTYNFVLYVREAFLASTSIAV